MPKTLLQALQDNDSVAAAEALRQGADVDQYMTDGVTPLIFTIKYCDIQMFHTVMAFKPDASKKDITQSTDPLDCAIRKPNATITQSLLDSRANPFHFFSSLSIDPHPSFAYVRVAFEEYEKDSTKERLNILKILHQHACFFGLQFFEGGLDDLNFEQIIMIGGSCSSSKSQVITTAQEFIAAVDPNEYLHWQKTLNNFRNSTHLLSRSVLESIFSEITQILEHINLTIASANGKEPEKVERVPILIPSRVQHSYGLPSSTSGSSSGNSVFIGNNGLFKNGSISIRIQPKTAQRSQDVSNPHELLLARTQPILDRNKDFKPFLDAINERDYSKALRRACTSSVPEAFELIKILFDYKDILSIDANARVGKNMQAAIHHAALNPNDKIYPYLVTYFNANVNLEDGLGVSAAALREQKQQPTPSLVQQIYSSPRP